MSDHHVLLRTMCECCTQVRTVDEKTLLCPSCVRWAVTTFAIHGVDDNPDFPIKPEDVASGESEDVAPSEPEGA